MADNDTTGRRSFLRKSAGAGVAGLGLTLAGCSGGGDGGDGSGDGGATNGDGGGMQEISITAPAAPWTSAVGNYMQDEGILDDLLGSEGYSYSMELTYGGPPLFASGQSDIAGLGATEASIMASTREFNIVIPGQTYVANGLLAVRPGSEYDPEEVGGVETAMQNVADTGTFGIGGWEGGDVKIFSVLFDEAFGLQFREEGGDFTVNSTGDYATLPQLIVDGDLDVGDIVVDLNGFPHFLSDPPRLTSLAFVPDLMHEYGFNSDAFGGIVCRQEFMDGNEAAVTAYVEAWQQGIDWFMEDPFAAADRYRDLFPGVENDEQLTWLADFAMGETDVANTPVFYDPVSLSDEWIDQQERFLDLAAEKDIVPSGWSEYVEFQQV